VDGEVRVSARNIFIDAHLATLGAATPPRYRSRSESGCAHKTAVISCKEIPGYMSVMTVSLLVRDPKDLANAKPGTMVDFVFVPDNEVALAECLRPHPYQGLEPDPATAQRLKLLAKAADSSPRSLNVGDAVPDFTLAGQDGKSVSFARFRVRSQF
jgi:hypothetical protein